MKLDNVRTFVVDVTLTLPDTHIHTIICCSSASYFASSALPSVTTSDPALPSSSPAPHSPISPTVISHSHSPSPPATHCATCSVSKLSSLFSLPTCTCCFTARAVQIQPGVLQQINFFTNWSSLRLEEIKFMGELSYSHVSLASTSSLHEWGLIADNYVHYNKLLLLDS